MEYIIVIVLTIDSEKRNIQMPVSVALGKDLEARLNRLAEATRRPKSFYLKEALIAYLDQMEDSLMATAYPTPEQHKEDKTTKT